MFGKIAKVFVLLLVSILFTSCVNLFSVFTPKEAGQTGNPQELVALGQYYMQQMDYDKAYMAYTNALALDSDNALALEGSAAAYFYIKVGSTNVLQAALNLAQSNMSGVTNVDAVSVFGPYINVQDLYDAFHYMSGNYEIIVSGNADASLSQNDSAVALFYVASAALDTVFQLVDLDGDGIITNDPDDMVTFTNLNPFVLNGDSNTSIPGVPLLFESTALGITNDLFTLVDDLTNGTNSLMSKTNQFIGEITNVLMSNVFALFSNNELGITDDLTIVTNLLDKLTNEIGPITNALVPQLSNTLSNTLEQTNVLASNLNARIDNMSNWVTNQQASISNWVINQTNEAVSNIAALTNDLSTNVDQMNITIDNFSNNVKSFTNDVNIYLSTNNHTNLLFDAWKASSIRSNRLSIDSDYTSMTNSLDSLTNRVASLPQDVTNAAESNVTLVTNYVNSNYTEITNTLTTNITGATNYLYSEVDRITNELVANLTNVLSSNLQPVLSDVNALLSNVDNITNRLGALTNRLNQILTNEIYTVFSNFVKNDLPGVIMSYLDDTLTNDTAYNSITSNVALDLLFKIPAVQRRLTNRVYLVKRIASNLLLNLTSQDLKDSISGVVDPILGTNSAVNYILDPISYFTNDTNQDPMMLSVTTNLLNTIFSSTNSSMTPAERGVVFHNLFADLIPILSDSLMTNFNLNDVLSNIDLTAILSNVDVDFYFTNAEVSNYLSYTNMDILMSEYFSNATTNVDLSSVFDSIESNLNTVKSNMSDTNNLITLNSDALLSNVVYPSNVTFPADVDSGYSDAIGLTTNVNQYVYVEPLHVDSNNVAMVNAVTANSNTRESNVVIFLTNEGMTTVLALYNSVTNVDTGSGILSTETNRIIQRSIEILTNGYEDLTNVPILIDVMTNTYNVNNFLWTALSLGEIQISPPDFFDTSGIPVFCRRNEFNLLG